MVAFKAAEVFQRDHISTAFCVYPRFNTPVLLMYIAARLLLASTPCVSSSSCLARLFSLSSTGRLRSPPACGCFRDPSSPLYLLLFCQIDFFHPELLCSCSCWHLLLFLTWRPVRSNGLSGRKHSTGDAEQPGEGAMQSSVELVGQKGLQQV